MLDAHHHSSPRTNSFVTCICQGNNQCIFHESRVWKVPVVRSVLPRERRPALFPPAVSSEQTPSGLVVAGVGRFAEWAGGGGCGEVCRYFSAASASAEGGETLVLLVSNLLTLLRTDAPVLCPSRLFRTRASGGV